MFGQGISPSSNLEPVNGFSFSRFWGSFEPNFGFKIGDNIRDVDIAPNFEPKFGQNNPPKSDET